jgi:hydrogenase maturation protein HypF
MRYGLVGHVVNHSGGVFIEVEGTPHAVSQFQNALTAEKPPLAHIESITTEPLTPCADTGFVILSSQSSQQVSAHIPPDVGICDACLRELFDPTDRRYHYPFINCTHCGPRFTIIQGIPYDRTSTTMAQFALCPACSTEYHDPLSRRFHAQPIACPVCGPQIGYQSKNTPIVDGTDAALAATQAALKMGQIVAIKGLGGFHLACDATNNQALETLRQRKGRVDKPFAVMVRDVEIAHQIALINDDVANLLVSRQRPIVLVRKRPGSQLSSLVAPGNPYIGLMLPYTPLHYLLLDETPLVMTSGNLSGEPIAIDNAEALERLAPLVDAFLLHNRPIHTPCDDSVLRVHDCHEMPIRRSRGYTPYPIQLPIAQHTLLATGGELKNTFCLVHQGYAFLSQHIGDMENLETLQAFETARENLCRLYRAEPQAIVCDLHPSYLTTQWAERHAEKMNLPLIRVQHHHAHIASVMAEHHLTGEQPIIGICLDGTGYGTDGTIWGGEILIADYRDFQRVAHLKPVPLPGGDAAIKRPYRMAIAHLWAAGMAWDDDLPPVAACSIPERKILARQFETGFQTVPTSSMGRLFDTVASLLGIRQHVTYEAQAAIELEGLLRENAPANFAFGIFQDTNGTLIIDSNPVIQAIVGQWRSGIDTAIIAARFHAAVADALVEVCLRLREFGEIVALSGGVFQNSHLLNITVQRLRDQAFDVLTHRQVPSNDGGLALGQAAVGSYRYSQALF